MSELLLINPRRRKRRASKRKTVTGRRNPRKMSALQKRYFGGGRKRRASSRRRVRVSGRRNPVAAVSSVRRRRSGSKRSLRGFKLVPANFIKGTVMPAAIGGAGALGVEIVYNMLPIPAGIKSGPLAPLAKIAGALGIGAIASMVGGRAMGEKVVGGYLTVLAYGFAKDLVSKAMPSLALGEYNMGYYEAGRFLPDNSMNAYDVGSSTTFANPNAPGMGAYVSGYSEGDNSDSWN